VWIALVAGIAGFALVGCASPGTREDREEAVSMSGTQTPIAAADGAGAESASRQAFGDLLELLHEISGEWIRPGRGVDDVEHDALAHESLAAVLQGALDFYLTEDFDKPTFTPIVTPRRKWSDNPDARYYFAPIRGDGVYRIRGQRGSEVYLSFTMHRGDRDGHWPAGVAATLNMQEMTFEPDGQYELVVSREPQPGNWMRLDPEAGSIVVRFYYQNERPAAADPETVPRLLISRDPDDDAPTPAADDATIAERLGRVANWVRSKYGFQVLSQPGRPLPDWFASEPNTLGPPESWRAETSGGGWGPVDVAYSAGPYRLGPDEALVMEGRLPEGVFSNVVLWNEMGHTEDYRDRTVSLNARQMALDADRRFRIVVAHADPGVANWLDTAGRGSGTIYWRHMLPAEEIEPVRTRVVPFAALSELR
jgi:hypothetical protein